MLPDNDDGAVTSNPAAQQTEIANRDFSQPAVRYLWILTVIFWGVMLISVSGIIQQIILMWSQP